MAVLVAVGVILWRVLSAVLHFVCSVPGLLIVALGAVLTAFTVIVANVWSCGSFVLQLFDTATTAVSSMMNYLSSVEYYGIFHHLFALDVLGRAFSTFVTLALTLVFLCVFDFFFQGLCVAIPFFIYKTLSKFLQAVSGGLTKPS